MRSVRCSGVGKDNCKRKLSSNKEGENEETGWDDEGERAVVIPLIVRVVPIRIKPRAAIVAIGNEDVRVTDGIV